MAGEKKSVVLPAVGLLALLPGAVTFLFARGEATRLNSDWVKICTPLLLIGAASFVVLLQRKLGNAGLGVGAAIAVGALGFAYFDLNRTVVERARWQASSRELSDMERFCRGKVGQPERARVHGWSEEPGGVLRAIAAESLRGEVQPVRAGRAPD